MYIATDHGTIILSKPKQVIIAKVKSELVMDFMMQNVHLKG